MKTFSMDCIKANKWTHETKQLMLCEWAALCSEPSAGFSCIDNEAEIIAYDPPVSAAALIQQVFGRRLVLVVAFSQVRA